jgi:hypothetical protein
LEGTGNYNLSILKSRSQRDGSGYPRTFHDGVVLYAMIFEISAKDYNTTYFGRKDWVRGKPLLKHLAQCERDWLIQHDGNESEAARERYYLPEAPPSTRSSQLWRNSIPLLAHGMAVWARRFSTYEIRHSFKHSIR